MVRKAPRGHNAEWRGLAPGSGRGRWNVIAGITGLGSVPCVSITSIITTQTTVWWPDSSQDPGPTAPPPCRLRSLTHCSSQLPAGLVQGPGPHLGKLTGWTGHGAVLPGARIPVQPTSSSPSSSRRLYSKRQLSGGWWSAVTPRCCSAARGPGQSAPARQGGSSESLLALTPLNQLVGAQQASSPDSCL